MNSVNPSKQEQTTVRVPQLYKKLGISNNLALKPPLHRDTSQVGKITPRRQTMLILKIPQAFLISQRRNTCQLNLRRNSPVAVQEVETPEIKPERSQTPKSRFIQNWIKNLKEKGKENDI